MTLYDILRYEEGYSATAYNCSEGYPTIGIGTKIGVKGAPLFYYSLVINEKVAKALLEMDVEDNLSKLNALAWYHKLNEDRKVIIQSMCYQLGFSGVMKFKKMIAAFESENYQEASNQALDSLWAKQTPERAKRHASVILGGDLNATYAGLI